MAIEQLPLEVLNLVVENLPHEHDLNTERLFSFDDSKSTCEPKFSSKHRSISHIPSGLDSLKNFTLANRRLREVSRSSLMRHLKVLCDRESSSPLAQRIEDFHKLIQRISVAESKLLKDIKSVNFSYYNSSLELRTAELLFDALLLLPELDSLTFDADERVKSTFEAAIAAAHESRTLSSVKRLGFNTGYHFLVRYCPGVRNGGGLFKVGFTWGGNNLGVQHRLLYDGLFEDILSPGPEEVVSQLKSLELQAAWSLSDVKHLAHLPYLQNLETLAMTGKLAQPLWSVQWWTALSHLKQLRLLVLPGAQVAELFMPAGIHCVKEFPKELQECSHPAATTALLDHYNQSFEHNRAYSGDLTRTTDDGSHCEIHNDACIGWDARKGDGPRFVHDIFNHVTWAPKDSNYSMLRFDYAYLYLARHFARELPRLSAIFLDESSRLRPTLDSHRHARDHLNTNSCQDRCAKSGRDVSIHIRRDRAGPSREGQAALDDIHIIVKRDMLRARIFDGLVPIASRGEVICPPATVVPGSSHGGMSQLSKPYDYHARCRAAHEAFNLPEAPYLSRLGPSRDVRTGSDDDVLPILSDRYSWAMDSSLGHSLC